MSVTLPIQVTQRTVSGNGGCIVYHHYPVKLNWFTRLFFRPIWREISRGHIRNDEIMWNGHGVEIDYYEVYAVTERCVASGMERIREEWKRV